MRLRLFNWLDNAKGREIKDDRVGNLEIDTIKVHQVSWWGAGVWENVWAGETHMSQTQRAAKWKQNLVGNISAC